jgi:DNA-directed RNA polymerase subunit L
MIMKKLDLPTAEDVHMRTALTYRCSPDVEFCGYSIPHPSEAVLHLRIQTWGKPQHAGASNQSTH